MEASKKTTTTPDSLISREHALLETYFHCLSQFAFEKAKDVMEKERETHKALFASSWGLLVNSLIHLAVAEKNYMSLMFLGQKWFVRKDTLRTNYGVLVTELRKIEECSQHKDLGLKVPSHEKILGHLCGQLGQYLTARAKMMDFYEQMSVMGANYKVMVYEDLINVITDIIQTYQKNFHHPIISPIKGSFSLECEIIHHLLQAQVLMSECQFLSTLLHLNHAHTKLSSWSHFFQTTNETKKMSFYGSSKQSVMPSLHQWLSKYKGVLVAKFALYFHETLSKQLPSNCDMKALTSKASVDYYSKIVSFQKKNNAFNISLVLDVNGIKEKYKGPGYQHPLKCVEPLHGKNTYPLIFSYPNEFPDKLFPEIVMLINGRSAELNIHDKVVHFFDKDSHMTYFLSRADPRITFVIIFESKKTEKDSYVTQFILDVCSQLHCTKLFMSLKAGSK